MKKFILSLFFISILFMLKASATVIFLPEGCQNGYFDCTGMQCIQKYDRIISKPDMQMDLLGVCANAQYLVLQVAIYYNNYKPALGGRTNGSIHAEGWFLRMADGSISEDTFFILINGGETVDYEYEPGKWVEVTSNPANPLMWQLDSYYGISSYGIVDLQIGISRGSYNNFDALFGVFF